ncbi:MAG: hypothetical protein Q8K58_01475 [Acidimicrobiales bacterium]|nr:hypothetical protein [Acidimicrobiales bacterium]
MRMWLRFSIGMFASAVVLLVSAGLGLVGSWALGPAAIASMVAALIAVVAMEERDHAAPRELTAVPDLR